MLAQNIDNIVRNLWLLQGCIVVFSIPTSYQNQGPSRTVCVNPSALLNCIAGVLCETDPREYVPQFVKAGKVERFWPTGAKPNEWTLRAAIDDIVSKGFVRESVVPLCFQVKFVRIFFSACFPSSSFSNVVNICFSCCQKAHQLVNFP